MLILDFLIKMKEKFVIGLLEIYRVKVFYYFSIHNTEPIFAN